MHIFFTTILRSNSSFHKFLNHFSFHSQHPSLIFPSLSPSFSVSHLEEGKMAGSKTIWFFVVLSISMLLSWTNPRGETLKSFSPSPLYYSNSSTQSASSSNDDISGLKYDFYHETCPQAESIIKTPTIAMSLHLSYAFSSTTASLRYYIHVCPFFLILLIFFLSGSSLF